MVEGYFPKSSVFTNSLSLNCFQNIFIYKVASFLIGYIKQDSNDILKQYSCFLTSIFWGEITLIVKV